MTAIVKYFHEEPASLEVLTPDLAPDARQGAAPRSLEAFLQAPRYYRGYLAGTDLATGRVGLTALPPEAYLPALAAAFTGSCCLRIQDGVPEPLDAGALKAAWRHPAGTSVLALSDAPIAAEWILAAAGQDRRAHLEALRRLLDVAGVVFFPEPAHHGYDWSLFAARPLRETLEAAFRAHPAAGTRRFVIPFREARSEEKFYFEQYHLSRYAAFEVVASPT